MTIIFYIIFLVLHHWCSINFFKILRLRLVLIFIIILVVIFSAVVGRVAAGVKCELIHYSCFWVKCINYQNVMCIQKIYFLQDLAGFLQVTKILQDSCKLRKSSKILARILQECHCIQESCMNWIFCRNLARFSNLQKTCKILQEINFLSN